ncbi:M50 family metallopeptidase [Paenibacillus sp.]|uniref:M50 family metallopeptidase n=1 Tax=Paenibacillus sp. TaxID=58172 RepID=UPI002D5F48AB|nr:M50 family metallopeptidase [Paenibacillus sp.]HZG58034.1 M50 family metallopeptidase [Paenibacillus sp.]
MWSRFERLIGVRFRLHPLFVLLLLLSAATGRFLEIVTLFGIVLIHEIGHAAMAKHLGWRMREVLLTPFGGVAVTDEDGSVPAREEALVAAAGPAMNLVMIGFAYAMTAAGVWTHAWTTHFAQANLTLMLFNLAPILPLDGGKLLRVGVGYAISYYRTLKLTTFWSLLASGALVGYASTRFGEGGPMTSAAVIGAFLLYANWYELRTSPYRFFRFLLARAARVRQWTQRGAKAHPLLAEPDEPLSIVARRLLRERLHRIVVATAAGEVVAVVPEERCAERYATEDQNRAVSDLFM